MKRGLPILACFAATVISLLANPTGGAVAAGSATIAGQGSPTVTINQSTNTAIINWQTFSIGTGELTKFIQPSSTSATLNRVLGGQTSFINGTLSANGQVYLINGNGIIVGAGGVISTAGFTGSTRDISDTDFLSGNLHFTGSGDAGVSNYGTINALGGDVVLIGKTVNNAGTISATGTAALAAGDDVLLAQQNPDGSTVTVNPVSSATPDPTKVGVKNTGTIKAAAAELKAANGNIYALAIENEGMVQATTVTQQGGHIYLTADSGTIVNSGTLNASATAAKGKGGTVLVKSTAGKVVHSGRILAQGGQGGTGGSVEISGAQVSLSGEVNTLSPGGTGGTFLLDPATLDVITGGGTNLNGSTVDPTTVDGYLNENSSLTLSASNGITISDPLAWTSGATLTLQTTTSGSYLHIDASITATTDGTTNTSGNGGLIIDLAGATDVAATSSAGAIDVANFILQRGAWEQLINDGSNGGNIPQVTVNNVTTNATLPAFTASNDFEIDNGTFLRASGGTGTSDNPYQLVDIYGVQGIEGFLSDNFTLNYANIDASVTYNWNSGDGFNPIGSEEAPFTGSINNGTINNLTIYLPDSNNVGLVSVLGTAGTLSEITINGINDNSSNITGNENVGALVGDNYGTVEDSYVGSANVAGSEEVGGAVGYNEQNAQVEYTGSYASVNGDYNVGGVVGWNDGSVYGDYFGGTVGGDVLGADSDENYDLGGVVGYNTVTGTITDSYFSGTVQTNSDYETSDVGGIAGENDGTISGSYTLPGAQVSGDYDVGGIAGYNIGFIDDCFNSGSVTGLTGLTGFEDDYNIGGIAGENDQAGDENPYGEESFVVHTDIVSEGVANSGIIQESYNTGTIEGLEAVGGIVGGNDALGEVNTAYNVGSVGTGDSSYSGGIVGDNYGTVLSTYNSGPVSGNSETTAGIIGYDEYSADTENSYWDTTTTGQTFATNSADGAYENNLASVSSPNQASGGSAYTITNNNSGEGAEDLPGAGYAFFGAATPVAGTNGVYAIGTSPDNNGTPAWYIIDGQTRPMLGMELNQEINSPHSLQLMAANLSGYYYQNQSLDMSVITNPSEVWTSNGFVPIGNSSNEFNGTFYGYYENISNLLINGSGNDDVGLFGAVGSEGSLYYVSVVDASITGNDDVGGLVGLNDGGLVYSSSNSNDGEDYFGSGGIQGSSNVGGIVGDNFGTVEYSSQYNNGDNSSMVVATAGSAGGIVGLNESGGSVTRGYNSGTIEVTGGYDAAGGIVGENDLGATVSESQNDGLVEGTVNENAELTSANIGGVVGDNYGTISQSINLGNVGTGVEWSVGGIAGHNAGQIDDSYSNNGTIDGDVSVGGLVGTNDNGSVLETSYSASAVEGNSFVGAAVGTDLGTVSHVYWDTDNTNELAGIGINNNSEDTTDATGYTTAELADLNTYTSAGSTGASPGLWDFSPETGGTYGVWGINVYNDSGQQNNGLPVLQWQYPVVAQVTATQGNQYYGYTPGYTATGDGAASLASYYSNGTGPTVSANGGNQAGDINQITLSGNTAGANIEYINDDLATQVTILPAPVDVVANSLVIQQGQTIPDFTATYTGLQNGETASSLGLDPEFTVSPLPGTAVGEHTITITPDLNSSNYAFTYFTGILNVTLNAPTQSQIASTFNSEVASLQTQFGNDPFNGINPIFFLSIPNEYTLGGDLFGAINDGNTRHNRDYAHGSSTSNLPGISRLVLPDTGVVEIINGAVVIGDPATGKPVFLSTPGSSLSQEALLDLQNVLSPNVYNELIAIVHAR